MEKLAQAMQRVKGATTLKAYCEGNLRRAPRGNSPYVCPICNSGGSGRQNSDTAFTITDERWHCHACDKGGDIFDLAGILNGTEDKAEQCDAVAEWAGVAGWQGSAGTSGQAYGWDDIGYVADEPKEATEGDSKAAEGQSGVKAHEAEEKAQGKADEGQSDHAEGRERHRAYIRQAQTNIEHPEAVAYLSSRGIDIETARAWGLGYDPNAGGAKDANGNWCRRGRIVIPWPSVDGEEPYYHIDRSIDPTAKSAKYIKPKSAEVGPQPLWNPKALKATAFFVVEGALDALAVQACGYEAVAICSKESRNIRETLLTCEGMGIPIVMLDNDEDESKGQKSQRELCEALEAAGRDCLSAPTEEMGVKDAGEAWAADRSNLAFWLGQWHDKGRRDALRKRMKRFSVVDPAKAVRDLYELKEARPPIATGLEMLDRTLNGGLHAKSLHVIGAQSSEGKTTITLQVADNIAKSGHPVLFVTIEQRTDELIAKSLSRIIYQGGGGTLTARDITNPMARSEWTEEQRQTLACARDAYIETVAPFMQFMDPEELPNVRMIEAWANVMADHYGEPPTIFVDYLQLLAPFNERDTDKQVTDKNVTALRQMAGRLGTAVWCVASLNRQSYTAPISTDSFKESGSIEYGADVLMGLEPFDLETRWYNAPEKKKAIVAKGMHDRVTQADKRWMDLRILKSRFGGKPERGLAFAYHARVDTFEEVWKVKRERRADDDVDMGEPLEWNDDGAYVEM